MNQIYRLDDAIRVSDIRYERTTNAMHTPLLLLEIQANALEIQRRDALLRDEQLRLARQQRARVNRLAGIRLGIANILIAAGHRLGGVTSGNMETIPTGIR